MRKGRFWEGASSVSAWRMRETVAAVHGYVDLNPVRADLAETPEESEFCGAGGPPAGASGERRSWRRGRRLAG